MVKMAKLMCEIPDNLFSQVQETFPETVGMTRPSLIKWALRKIVAEEVKTQCKTN